MASGRSTCVPIVRIKRCVQFISDWSSLAHWFQSVGSMLSYWSSFGVTLQFAPESVTKIGPLSLCPKTRTSGWFFTLFFGLHSIRFQAHASSSQLQGRLPANRLPDPVRSRHRVTYHTERERTWVSGVGSPQITVCHSILSQSAASTSRIFLQIYPIYRLNAKPTPLDGFASAQGMLH